MKFLSLLGAVYADWFTVRKKFTVCVAVIFFLASFVMTFTASLVGGDVLWLDFEIEDMLRRYCFYDYNREYADIQRLNNENTHINAFIDAFSSYEKGNLDSAEIKAGGLLIDAGGARYTDIDILPYFAETEERHDFLSHTEVYRNDWSDKAPYYEILGSYSLIDGRLIDDSDFSNTAYVIVLPASMGVKVGDTVNFSNCELEVIGLTGGSKAELPASTLAEIYDGHSETVNTGGEHTQINQATVTYSMTDIYVNDPLSEENRSAIEETVKNEIGTEFVFLQFSPPDNGLENAYVLEETVFGAIVALFSVLCVYNVAVRLCTSTMPMMQLFKLCGMKRGKVILILFISLFSLLAVCFGLACLAIVATKPVIQGITDNYVVRDICFALSAVLMTAASLTALLPRIIRLAGSKISTSPGGDNG